MKNNCLAFMSDLQQKDIQLLEKWFNSDSVVWVPPAAPIKGQKKILILFRAIFQKYKTLHWQVQEVYEIEQNRCLYMSASWGILKNEVEYNNSIITDIIFNQQGEILHLSDYFKNFTGSASSAIASSAINHSNHELNKKIA